MEYRHMNYERVSNAILLTFTDTKTLNSLSTDVLIEFAAALEEIENAALADRSIRALILTGSGKAFIAGADIAEMHKMSPVEAREFSRLGSSVMIRLENLRLPTIAAVNGFALGGGLETVLACDFAYVSKKARLGLPEATLGLVPGFGGHMRLTDRIGRAMTKELVFTGRMINAEEALRLGIANRICEAGDLIDEAIAVCEEMAKTSPHSAAEAKEIINLAVENDTAAMTAIESNKFGLIFSHSDSKEGKDAFLNKRTPKWRKD